MATDPPKGPSAGKTTRVEHEEPNFFERSASKGMPKDRQGLLLGIRNLKFGFGFGFFIMVMGGIIGPAYVKHYYSPAFMERLEASVASKRQSFWMRRNQAQSYVTQKVTPWAEYLGWKSWDLRP